MKQSIKKIYERKKSVLVEWACSYVIILLIPLIAICINYFHNTRIIRNEVFQANELVLNSLKDSMDRYLYEEKSLYAYFLSNDTFEALVSNSKKDAQFYYDVSKLMGQIANYNNYGMELSCMIYFTDKDYVIGNSGANDSKYYFDRMRLLFSNEMEYEEWLTIINGEYRSRFLVERYLHYKKGESCVVYANSVTYAGYDRVNIFVSIPGSTLAELTRSLSPGTILVISRDKEGLLALSDEGMQDVSEELEKICATNQEHLFETEDYIGILNDSAMDGIEYRLLIPKEAFWTEMVYARNILCVSVAATLFIGFFSVWILLKRSYKPVSELVAKTVGSDGKGNEFKRIEHAYANLMDENHTMYKRILSQKATEESHYLLDVMKGRIPGKKDNIVILEPGQRVALAAFSVPLRDEKQIQQDEILLFVVDNIFSELMGESVFYRIGEGHYLFYMFVIEGDGNEWKRRCIGEASYLCDIMKGNGDISLTAAVSGIRNDLGGIRYLYQDILEAFEDMKLLGRTGVADTEIKYQSKARNMEIVQSIMEYVEENYANTNLNITTIADGIGRNPKYISRVFKDETQESILDYVNRMRIGKAQAMLRTRRFTVEQVSGQVGYASVKTFRRAFTKIVGSTPGEAMKENGDKR